VDTSQNVGIGVTSPSAKLNVRTSTTGSTANGIMLDAGAQQHSWYLADNFTSSFYVGSSSGLFTWGNSGGERMRIDSSGNLLLNTTSASGNNSNSIVFLSNQGYIVGNHLNGTASATRYASWDYNGSEIGFISQNGTTGVTYGTSSDYRLKENITPMTGGLAKVAQLKPCTYKWKTDGTDGQGFIAHELQEIVPDCVTGTKDEVDKDGNPVYQGIDTSFLVATLTAAIQELKAELDELKAKVG
jgi:hypothetical protein